MTLNLDIYYDNQLLASYLVENKTKPTETPTVSIDLTQTIDFLIKEGRIQRWPSRHVLTAVKR